jgi:phosphohistidine phosphatase SixA
MIVFVLRHADRAADGSDALSPKGMARAKRLGQMLIDSGVTRAFRSDAARTGVTLKPLKLKLGGALIITTISTSGSGGVNAHIQGVVTAIQALPADAVAIVVSHSNTVGPIILGLGGGDIAPIAENEFDKLFILCGPPAAKKPALLLRY